MGELKLPRIGFGTYGLTKKAHVASILKAIDAGFRFFDTAQIYKNEALVGEAIAASSVPRDELLIGSKVWVTNLKPDKVIKSTEASLRKLHIKTIDVMYVHWPARRVGYKASTTLKAFSKLVDEEKIRYIGVSNFTPALLDEAIQACDKPILVNQVEHHPLLQQREMRKYLADHDMYLVAYCPTVNGRAGIVPELVQVAKKHGVSAHQVSLAWIMDHGAVPIPKAMSEAHIKDDFAAQDLKLDSDDVAIIDAIKTEMRKVSIPLIRPKW